MGIHHTRQVHPVRDQERVYHSSKPTAPRRHTKVPAQGGDGAFPGQHSHGNPRPTGQTGYTEGPRSSPPLPVASFRSTQALGKIQDDPESKSNKPVHTAHVIPHGNTGLHSTLARPRGLGSLYRLSRRLPSRTHRRIVPEAARLRLRREMLPIQGPPLRPEARSTPFHQAGVGSGGLPQAAGDQAILLLGRLANSSRQPRARKSAF